MRGAAAQALQSKPPQTAPLALGKLSWMPDSRGKALQEQGHNGWGQWGTSRPRSATAAHIGGGGTALSAAPGAHTPTPTFCSFPHSVCEHSAHLELQPITLNYIFPLITIATITSPIRDSPTARFWVSPCPHALALPPPWVHGLVFGEEQKSPALSHCNKNISTALCDKAPRENR